ncbi:MAG: ClpXP protease specificity-enhancing factor [Pseudomonadales bacterium]
MNSSTPYLLRAINEWILDNDCTPHIVVDATVPGVSVPQGYVSDGQIVLNISPVAVRGLSITDEAVMFDGRFEGVAHEIHVPIVAVMAIIARENGEGVWFPMDEDEEEPEPPPTPRKNRGRPHLKVVK